MTAEQKVKQKYPAAFAHYIICGMANSYWSIMDGENEISRTYCGAQIEVIEKRMTNDQIYDKLDEEEWNETLVDSANDARNWLTGDEPEPPSKGWAELVE